MNIFSIRLSQMNTNSKLTRRVPVHAIIVFLILVTLLIATPVQAQESTPPSGSSCLVCHDNLYYLYDTGKWFCQCETQMTCTCCHGGNPESMTEDEAHHGMVLYPTRNDSSACQQCHPDDYKARVERFSEIAGVSQIHSMSPNPTSSLPAATEINSSLFLSDNHTRSLEPWRITGLIAVSIAFIVLIIFAYRCWKADCLARKTK